MNTISRFNLLILALALLWCQPVWADPRQDAVSVLDQLHQTASSRITSEELKSVDATFAIAEHYFQENDLEQSERFYLLTVQKARIILSSTQKATDHQPPVVVSAPVSVASTETLPVAASEPAPTKEQQATVPTVSTVEHQPIEPSVTDSTPVVTQETATPAPETVVEIGSEIVSDKLVGTASTYTVVKGDTLRLVAAKLGVSRQQLIKRNNLDEKALLKIGQKLAYNNLKIIPQKLKNGIIVNIPDRTLYFFKQGKVAVSIPVALGVATKTEKYDWQTPTGKFKITAKMKDPTWHVPPSIQSEMEDHGKEVITSVPPGDNNPLGKFAIKTSIPGILIHSTTKPWSIYSFASHGCIRVYPEQMEEFFKEIKVNTLGEIIYKPVKLAVTDEGRVFLEVHRDIYSKSTSLATEAKHLIEKHKLTGKVDWKKVDAMVLRKAGIAEDISL